MRLGKLAWTFTPPKTKMEPDNFSWKGRNIYNYKPPIFGLFPGVYKKNLSE